MEADAVEKAAAYANEALTAGGGNYGDAVFYGNMVLGEIALRQGDTGEAKRRLIASGKTPGSPALGSFGPNMTLARDLLQRGESETVLEFFTLCRSFWKMGFQDSGLVVGDGEPRRNAELRCEPALLKLPRVARADDFAPGRFCDVALVIAEGWTLTSERKEQGQQRGNGEGDRGNDRFALESWWGLTTY